MIFRATPLFSLLLLAGCSYNQSKPPTPEGLKLIKARTGSGTVNTKLEARSEPNPPRAGEVSIWSLKVFDIKDKETGEREEWKFFNQLPQSKTASEAGISAGTTEVLMRAWLISKDGKVFLPQTPSYKAYGSFVTDWIIPRSGPYTLWVQYEPAKRGQKFPLETARWDFQVAEGEKRESGVMPIKARVESAEKLFFTAYDTAGKASGEVAFDPEKFRLNQVAKFNWSAPSGPVANEQLVALSPDGKIFVAFPPDSTQGIATRFTQKGRWRLWFSFHKNEELFIAPGFLDVS